MVQSRLFPHLGQNLAVGGSFAPQRLHRSEADTTGCPQFPQKVLPGSSGDLQCGHTPDSGCR